MATPVSPVIPGENFAETIFGAEQPQYLPLPALYLPSGTLITRWELSEEERARVAETGELWVAVETFHQPLQPLRVTGLKPEVQS